MQRNHLKGDASMSGAMGGDEAENCTRQMVLSHRMERSILDAANLSDYVPFAVGDRRRYATCSDIAWFPGPYLAVINLYGQHLRIYRFDDHSAPGRAPARLQLLHEITEGVPAPEGVSVSSDGKLLAIGHSLTEDIGVSLFPSIRNLSRPGRGNGSAEARPRAHSTA
jgi:hypothetical protein